MFVYCTMGIYVYFIHFDVQYCCCLLSFDLFAISSRLIKPQEIRRGILWFFNYHIELIECI